jgi:hypothetical protein
MSIGRIGRTAFAAVFLLAGCGSSSSANGPWTRSMGQVRAVWSAEQGIDLLTGPAVVARAYLESFVLASKTGRIDDAYPGFMHAVDTNAPTAKAAWPWPNTLQPTPHPVVGTYRFHILRFDTIGHQVNAVVCDWDYGAAFDLGGGKYGTGLTQPADGVGVEWIAMTVPGEGAPESPLPPQTGPAPAPANNVFQGWRIGGHLVVAAADPSVRDPSEWPSQLTDAQQCQANAPDPADRRQFLTAGVHSRSDYPTLSANPGWPAG